jgi:type I restriction enzyme M protein
MLSKETKKHIDNARQVLVGVVPNPTSQIDQITNALIYKFMDDMDQAAIKHGDEPSFFVGDLEKYSWTKVIDSKIGNQERMNLYSEALLKFSESKNLPELFRSIFKSAFLPYRSPETLGLFLKEINHFDYSHPEELGNAYEYLLSIMSSQGDAGQFRTPRHIIDFMVDVINPTKNDKILDPACGTGGFLVSSYKHILEQHDGKDDPQKKERPLTPDERKKLMQNIEGYDIDPSMARIASVNMYLHQFKNPKISQYDTLSSEERWGDKYDVILANPPFMSPKGGIKPHTKFTVPSTRSEVLFVDYIMNHLRPKGRAAIIVPEGVIFQSGTSYKQLREKLIKDGLYAVASLPSGVFQPYSGVKTSILFFDNDLAKQTNELLFVKIENDGFALSAQRREVNQNDLPQALEIFKQWRLGEKVESKIAVYVSKKEVSKTGDYNLSVDRYAKAIDYSNAKWPMVELGEVVEILDNQRRPITKSDREAGDFPYYGATGVLDYVKNYIFDERLVLIGEDGAKWGIGDKTAFIASGKYWVNNHAHVVRPIKSKLIDTFLVENLNSIDLSPFITGVTVPKLNQGMLRSIKIPLPPLEIQEQIVAELDSYQKIIEGAKQITQNWKPKIDIDPTWPKVKLNEACDVRDGTHDSPKGVLDGYPLITSKNIKDGQLDFSNVSLISEEDFKKVSKRSGVEVNDIIMPMIGTIGGACLIKPKTREFAIKNVALFKRSDKILPKYLLNFLNSDAFLTSLVSKSSGATQKFVSLSLIRSLEINLPSIEIQKQIVERIEEENAFFESAKKLIEIYEQKTKATIAKVWSE